MSMTLEFKMPVLFVNMSVTCLLYTSIKVGEQVVTSYVSDRFVQGLFIGYISEINVDSNNLTRSGYITPAVDFSKIQEVLVLTKTKEDMTNGADDESASDTAKGE